MYVPAGPWIRCRNCCALTISPLKMKMYYHAIIPPFKLGWVAKSQMLPFGLFHLLLMPCGPPHLLLTTTMATEMATRRDHVANSKYNGSTVLASASVAQEPSAPVPEFVVTSLLDAAMEKALEFVRIEHLPLSTWSWCVSYRLRTWICLSKNIL